MKKSTILSGLGMIIFFLSGPVLDAQRKSPDSTAIKYPANNPYFVNSYPLQPVLLPEKSFKVLFNTDIPHYFKWYAPSSGKPEKLSDKMVINEANFNAGGYYGLSNRINLFLSVPIRDVHYYSPMGVRSGTGFGDIQTGISYSLIPFGEKEKNSLSTGLTLGFPSGKYKNLGDDDAALGEGSFRFKGDLTGLVRMDKYNLIYSVYYEYRTNHSGMHIGDETGVYTILQKPFNTPLGHFGVEASAYAYWKFKNTFEGNTVMNSEDYAVHLGAGGWYNFIGNFYLRFNVPFAVFRNKAWFTQYRVMVQLDYYF